MTRIPETPVRLSPEQAACSHNFFLKWSGLEGIFHCSECGAPLVIPELGETIDLDVASEPLDGSESEMERARR